MEFLRLLLLPFSVVYGLITGVRNLLFDLGVLQSRRFDIPVISVGNLSTGGTGKTPHVEYLIRLLSPFNKVSTLSRGYGRRTRGYLMAKAGSTAANIGDEPMQYFRKFPEAGVHVDEKRRRGIENILKTAPETDVILLDDAFQHRYVTPGFSFLLTDYHKLYYKDYILPVGSLREARRGARRADVIVVTKTPSILSPILRRQIIAEIKPAPHQKVYFSYIRYSEIVPLWSTGCHTLPDKKFSHIMVFAGIANTYPLQDHLAKMCQDLTILQYPDHHQYTLEDLDRIKRKFDDLYSRNKLLVTTEKDAMRLLSPGLDEKARQLPVHYLPIIVEFHRNDKQAFDEQILNYVRTNQRKH
jgi:tetraacyldisaccharide 4'-kinase